MKDNRSFLKAIDTLPGPKASWYMHEIGVTGTLTDENNQPITEALDLWGRNPVHLIEDLIGNPEFDGEMAYEPRCEYEVSEDGGVAMEYIDDMHSGKWMSEVQKILPQGATAASVIIASDKTQLSVFSGDKQAWPVYLTIGNISKTVRKSPSRRAVVLLGYIPVSKLLCFPEKERALQGYRLFHYCMSLLLKPLIEAGINGVEMVCADGVVRRIHPVLAAYLADFPEQCLITCCKQNRCPTCIVEADQRGEPLDSLYRDPTTTKAALNNPVTDKRFTNEGLHHVPEPFWANLPYANIFACIAPDLLHQLHKGVFKDHLVKWVSTDLEDEVDARMARVPPYQDLRIFKRGISKIKQWTGNEYRQMERVFVGVASGLHASHPRVLVCTRAILDFIYLAHLPRHSTTTLTLLRDALATFHANKQVFVDLGLCPHFNIPKLHWLIHYLDSIINLGPCDGLSTDISERLHIDFTKLAYRASNRRDYLKQMVTWLTRREKVRYLQSYFRWAENSTSSTTTSNLPISHTLYPDEALPTAAPFIPSDGAGEDAETWLISRTPGLGVQSGQHIQSQMGAPSFEQALSSYLQSTSPIPLRLPNLLSSSYGLYKQVTTDFKAGPFSLEQQRTSRIRASPAMNASPSRYDTVLISTGWRKHSGLTLHDCRAAQVRVIFTLPPHLERLRPSRRESDTHLAYIEWFTPFTAQADPTNGLYRIARAYENRVRKAAIVPVSWVVRSCHLIPVWGPRADRRWTSDTVLEFCDDWYLNMFSDHAMYTFGRLTQYMSTG
ncbi:uncharacterized protein BXZ73DRAFT_43384 [Epithele typhae]|uniref:uncharacterized protein n=1 Tax=Epithele typhae TaxID=378194 RepID=UPI0020074C82|nr:uncharacterized protein BXZ73DRAFT_43384 [Epithele typhae]KAH9939740.1 hypothetical protein BXZ73DRAFT_43384 [Epithele typhae]